MASKFDLTGEYCIDQGAKYSITLSETDDDGNPIDFTLWDFRGELKVSAQDSVAVAEFTFTKTSATEVDCILTSDETKAITCIGTNYSEKTVLYYDIERYILDDVVRMINGKAEVSPNITKEA